MERYARCGFPHVNMDLIAGLPEDTAEGLRQSLDRCLTYGPDDITVHTLALKKGSRILTEGLRIPGAETVAEMLDYASPTLRTAGYRPYYLYRQKYMSGSFENIGWCRSGGECWYNVDIMSELLHPSFRRRRVHQDGGAGHQPDPAGVQREISHRVYPAAGEVAGQPDRLRRLL